MKHSLIPEGGSFYKASLHTHSTCSDGTRTVEEIKADYMAHGYSVVAFTDHDIMIDHSDLNEAGRFLTLTSYEVETNDPTPVGANYHLNFYAPHPNEAFYPCANPGYTWGNASNLVQDYYRGDYVRRYSTEGQNEMIREARAHGFLVTYNHPGWSLQHYPDYAGLEGLTALEVYNTGSVRIGYTLDAEERVLDDLLSLGKRIYPVAADDSHGTNDCFGGWVQIKAPELSYDVIMQAFAAGDLYASWGPELHALYIEDGILYVECSDTVEVNLTSAFRHPHETVRLNGEAHARCSFDLHSWLAKSRAAGRESREHFRLVLVDANGNKALTRGYFADELSDIV